MWSPFRRQRTNPPAGEFAASQYRTLYRPWRRRLRLVAPLVFAVLAIALLPLFLLLPDHQELFLGLVLGAFAGIYLAMADSPPEWIDKWRRGAEGERRTGRELEPLGRQGWRIVHDLLRPAGGNLDHLVIGDAGVFLLETKSWSGEIAVGGGRISVRHGDDPLDTWARRSPSGVVKFAAVQLSQTLREATGFGVFVRPVVVVWGNFPARLVEDEDVVYVAGDRLRDWLLRQPRRLSSERIERISAAIEPKSGRL